MNIFASVAERRAASSDLMSYGVSRFILPAPHWRSFVEPVPITWAQIRFSNALLDAVPDNKRGVYCFVAEPRIASHPACSYLMYIGKTTRSFRARYHEYLREMNDPKGRHLIQNMLITWENYLYFYYAEIQEDKIGATEEALLHAYLPPMNEKISARIDQIRKWD